MKHILSIIGRIMYRIMGWRLEPLPPYVQKKHVLIAFPHTSNKDTVLAFTGFRVVKRTGHIMIKQEWFFWPMSLLLRLLGGIPVHRAAPHDVVRQMAEQFRNRDEFLLAIVPEGTRKKIHTIRTGFWHIAKAAEVSIICWYLDNETRCARWLGEVIPGESKKDDLILIQKMYNDAGYLFPLDVEKL